MENYVPEQQSYASLFMRIMSCVVFFALGSGLAAYMVYLMSVSEPKMREVRDSWEQVPAEVLECRVTHSAPNARTRTEHHWLSVRYRYRYGNHLYESTNAGSYEKRDLDIFEVASRRALAYHTRPSYYLPDDLTCFVNPAHPEEAVLFCNEQPGAMYMLGFWLLMGSGFALFFLIDFFMEIGLVRRKMRMARALPRG